MASIEILVPDDTNVEITGVGLMGGFDHSATLTGRPDVPTVVISGLTVMAQVAVERRPCVTDDN
jgi:hypothetical protein